jgi:hypothetical protein
MLKLTKAHYLLISLQVLSLVNGLIHIGEQNWFGAGIALGLFIIFMPSKANIQFYSRKRYEALDNNTRTHMTLRYFGIFILLLSLSLDLFV